MFKQIKRQVGCKGGVIANGVIFKKELVTQSRSLARSQSSVCESHSSVRYFPGVTPNINAVKGWANGFETTGAIQRTLDEFDALRILEKAKYQYRNHPFFFQILEAAEIIPTLDVVESLADADDMLLGFIINIKNKVPGNIASLIPNTPVEGLMMQRYELSLNMNFGDDEIFGEDFEEDVLIEENYDEIEIGTLPDNGLSDVAGINSGASIRYTSFRAMYDAISDKPRKQKYSDPRKSCESALGALHDTIDEPSDIMLDKASKITNAYLKSNLRGIYYSSKKGLANKKIYEGDEVDLMNSLAAAFQKLAQTYTEKPDGTIRTPGGIATINDAAGTAHRLPISYEISTGRVGGQEGTPARTMPAALYLSNKYGLQEKNQIIAGHLVTMKAGGKAQEDNLSPFPSYDFNQTVIRGPEIIAEQLIRANKVFKYSSVVRYGRTSANGSHVAFDDRDLPLIGKSVHVRIDELALREGGNGRDIRDWGVSTNKYNNSLPISLQNVVAGDNSNRYDEDPFS